MTASDQVTRTSKSPHSNGAVDKTPSGSRASLRSSLPQLAAINPEPGLWYSSDTLASSGKRYLVPDDVSDGRQHFGADENAERGNWTGQLDFLLSCIGYAVGLGNVWRFPYLCYRNGGGAFFVPYIIMLSFIGMPLFFMELSLGQFSSNGPLTCWGFSPLFKGLGVAQLVISAIVSIYYNMIIAWSLYYFFASFTSSLPWADCSHWWNTDNCSLKLPDAQCDESSLHKYVNGTCYNSTTFIGLWNYTLFRNKTGISRHSPSEEYYNHRVLNISPTGISDMGPVQWELALCLLGAWIIAFLCMIKGIKSSGKVVYFTAIFPYVVLVILFGRGVSLPNAWNGIYFYIVPKWEKLGDAKVWNDAAVQIFFSLSDCWGGLIALSSYNRFHNNVLRDTIIVSMGNCLTSVFAGVVIFSFIGFMAGEMNAEVENVVDKGPGLAFIVYPDAVSRMVVAPLWAILFFTMLITLGLDSQSTTDRFEGRRESHSWRRHVQKSNMNTAAINGDEENYTSTTTSSYQDVVVIRTDQATLTR
ncbi:Sodium- and chloride-dependent glycine transporter 2 [Lamellibrachia satsuma]|nr:Sodium- and chloride-dependent glycine transporter 2 [Lamellibrachia satsuma]